MAYCHSLAVAGGERLIKRWGDKASVVETEQGELTAAMVSLITLPPRRSSCLLASVCNDRVLIPCVGQCLSARCARTHRCARDIRAEEVV